MMRHCYKSLAAPLLLMAGFALVGMAQADILNDRYDQGKTGANLNETILTASNVNSNLFGRLWSYPVDGEMYAQPLYKTGVVVPNGTKHNVLYAATIKGKLYAFDADSSSATPLWSRDFSNLPLVAPVDTIAVDGGPFSPPQGPAGTSAIYGTPVIDPATNTLYVLVRTKEVGHYAQRLHAVDITTGADKFGGAVQVSAQAPGAAQDAVNGIVSFNAQTAFQRAALALVNGVVFVSWASDADITPWHGWIIGFNAATLAEIGAFCTTPDGNGGGVWQSGRGPAVDGNGNVYYETGNGSWDGSRNFGQSVVRLQASTKAVTFTPGSSAAGYNFYTPGNWAQLTSQDLDLSSTGPLLVPNTTMMIAGSKASVLYEFNTSASLGGFDANNTSTRVNNNGLNMNSGPAYWTSASLGGLMFVWTQADYLKSYRFSGTSLSSTVYAQGQDYATRVPGGALTVSANGTSDASGVVWALTSTIADPTNVPTTPGVLRAYQATTLAEIWNSEMVPARDRLGNLTRYTPPVVVNGRVYTTSQNGGIVVYALLQSAPTAGSSIGVLSRATSVIQGQTALISVGANAINGSATVPSLTIGGLPSGASSSVIAPASIPGTFTAAISTSATTPVGTYSVSVSSGGATDYAMLTVAATNTKALAVPLNLVPSFNVLGLATDGSTFTGAGFDGSGNVFSANAVGSPVIAAGIPFSIGSANTLNAVSSATVPLPAGYFTSLALLGAAVYGNQPNQVFTVNYLDGTSTQATLSISDWCSPQNYGGETIARSMAYRNTSTGASVTNCTLVDLYQYSIPVVPTKLVKSLQLPSSGNMRIMAISAVPAIAPAAVNIQAVANVTGIYTDKAAITNAGLDNSGYAFSATLLGSSITWSGVSYGLGSPGVPDAVSNVTVPLPATNAGSLRFLAAAVNWIQTGQVFTVTYTDGTSTATSLSMSDWCSPQHYPGESVVASMAYRDYSGGTTNCGGGNAYLYGYSMVLDPSRTPKTLTLPANRNVSVLSAALLPPELATPVPFGTSANIQATTTDGSTLVNSGLGASTFTYSANALPATLQWNGTPFATGAVDNLNALSAVSLPLPAINAGSVKFLGASTSGNLTSQPFTVTYTDGTSTTTNLSLSSWCGSSGNPGESIVFYTLYFDYAGSPFYGCSFENLYGYTIALDISRTVQTLTLPNNPNIAVLAVTLQ